MLQGWARYGMDASWGWALGLSVVAWAIAGAATTVYIMAFHPPAPWYAGFFVLAVIHLGGAIPSSPGALGVYHYLAMLALSVWVTDKNALPGYAIGTHGIGMLLTVVLGGVCLAREGISFRAMGLTHQIVQPPALAGKPEKA